MNLPLNTHDDKLNKVLQFYTPTKEGKIYSERKNSYMAEYLGRDGYVHVVATIKGKAYNFPPHRLVAYYYIHNPDALPVVNHLDGNKLNNSVDNLEWTTHSGNVQHAHATGLIKDRRGANRSFTDEEVMFIRNCRKAGLSCNATWKANFSHLNEGTFENVWYNQYYKEIK